MPAAMIGQKKKANPAIPGVDAPEQLDTAGTDGLSSPGMGMDETDIPPSFDSPGGPGFDETDISNHTPSYPGGPGFDETQIPPPPVEGPPSQPMGSGYAPQSAYSSPQSGQVSGYSAQTPGLQDATFAAMGDMLGGGGGGLSAPSGAGQVENPGNPGYDQIGNPITPDDNGGGTGDTGGGDTAGPLPTPQPTTPGGSGNVPGMPPAPPNPYDQAAIRAAIIAGRVAQGGTAESVTENDFAYWTQKIMEHGGLTDYWLDRLRYGNDPNHYGNGPQPNPTTPTPTTPGPTTPAPTPTPAPNVPTPLPIGEGGGNQYDAMIEEQIRRLLAEGNSPVTGDDPAIRAQFDPMSATLQRGAQRTKAAAAERAAAQGASVGGAGGSLDAQNNSINEDTGDQEGQLMSQFVTQEIGARRQKVVLALQTAQGEQKMQLEKMLANMNDALQRLQLQQQNAQYYAGLGQNNQHFYDNLHEQHNQFYDNFGRLIGEKEYNDNQDYFS